MLLGKLSLQTLPHSCLKAAQLKQTFFLKQLQAGDGEKSSLEMRSLEGTGVLRIRKAVAVGEPSRKRSRTAVTSCKIQALLE